MGIQADLAKTVAGPPEPKAAAAGEVCARAGSAEADGVVADLVAADGAAVFVANDRQHPRQCSTWCGSGEFGNAKASSSRTSHDVYCPLCANRFIDRL